MAGETEADWPEGSSEVAETCPAITMSTPASTSFLNGTRWVLSNPSLERFVLEYE